MKQKLVNGSKRTENMSRKDDVLMELETEKVNVELTAEASGVLTILVADGETVAIGAVIGSIDESAEKPAGSATTEPQAEQPAAEPAAAAPMNPAVPKIAPQSVVLTRRP